MDPNNSLTPRSLTQPEIALIEECKPTDDSRTNPEQLSWPSWRDRGLQDGENSAK